MLPYIVLLVIPFFVYGIVGQLKISKKYRNSIVIILFFSIWFLLLVFRDVTVGTDIQTYVTSFNKIARQRWTEFIFVEREQGYWLLCKLISLISKDEHFFLTIIAAITIFPVCYLFSKEGENPLICIAIFINLLFSMYFSGIRQCLAMSFVIPAYYFTREKKFIKFILMVLLGFLFHQSTLVVLLLYPVYHVRITKKITPVLLLIFTLIFLLRSVLFSEILNLIGGIYEERYSEVTATGAFTMLLLFIIFLFYVLVLVPERNENKDFSGLKNILYLIILFQIFASVNTVAMRMNYYFFLFLPMLISKVPSRVSIENDKLAKVSVLVIVFVLTAYFIYNGFMGNDILNVFPYKSYV